jgi:hypothetical protein
MRFPAVMILPLISACVQMAAPVPQEARLSASRLSVVLTDGTKCSASIEAVRLDRCGKGYDVVIDLVEKPNFLRQLAERAFGALGAEGNLAPMGKVVLTDAAGRSYRFVSPEPVE